MPRSEFYASTRARDGLYPRCKLCQNKATSQYKWKRRTEPGYESEGVVINILRDLGIYAAPGKLSEYHHLDVIAWGCVRIEVKTSQQGLRGFSFNMGNKIKKEHERSDLVVLICYWDDYVHTYHVFPSDHPVFYRADGSCKKGVPFNVGGRHNYCENVVLTRELMIEHQDRWDLIEQVRQRVISQLKQNAAEIAFDISELKATRLNAA